MTKSSVRVVLVMALAALVLAACSVSRLAYLNATPLAMWYLASYVDMSGTQKEWARDRLARAIDWHRSEELPEYRRFLEKTLARFDEDVPVAEVREIHADARRYYHRMVERLLPDMAELLLQLDAAQLAHLEEKLDESNRKIVRESVKGTPAQRREKAVKKYIDQFEDWTGRLSDSQREIVARHVREMPDTIEERLGDRRYRQTEVLTLARARVGRDRMVAGLRKVLIDTESWRRPEYLAKIRERDNHIFAIVSELNRTLTPEQRGRVERKTRGYVRDISELSAAAPAPRVAQKAVPAS